MKKIMCLLLLIMVQVVSANEALSGDIVGNGWEINTDHHDVRDFDQFIDHERLDDSEIKKRNQKLGDYLRSIGFDEGEFRSGDIVGNGGGYHESQAAFFYASLEKQILSALSQEVVSFDSHERQILFDIIDVVRADKKTPKMIFVDEKDFPKFFFEHGIDAAPRVAKTGFDMTYPIFINREMVVKRIELDPLFWIGVLIHELGHQVGVASHSYLTNLGAKVRLIVSLAEERIMYPILGTAGVQIKVLNHYFEEGLPDVIGTYEDKTFNFNDWNDEGLKERCGKHTYKGFELTNMHWKNKAVMGMADNLWLYLGAWAVVRCQQKSTGAYYNQTANLQLTVKVGKNDLSLSYKIID